MEDYQKTANKARLKVLDLIYNAQSSHIGSNFSCIDILTVLFHKMERDDVFILSKGWASASLYYFLSERGLITKKELNTFCQEGSKLIGLTEPSVNGVVFGGGSMGFGMPCGVGMALSKKINKDKGKVFILMSDGELMTGTTWESALIASKHNLDNLFVIVDNNGLCGMGKTKEVLEVNFPNKLGWNVFNINGHNFKDLEKIGRTKTNKKEIDRFRVNPNRPNAYIAYTIKGKGVPFMENDNLWHYKAPNKEEYEKAKEELQNEG